MAQVVFHAGAHKCATTSLQRLFASYAAKTPNVFYIPPARRGLSTSTPPVPELRLLNRFVKGRTPPDVTALSVADGFCRLIDDHPERDRFIISDEIMIGEMPGLGWSFYPFADRTRAVIDIVAKRHPTTVLLQSRETASYLRSSHQFRVGQGFTLGYLHFLQKYDLASISWVRLGDALFENADFEWAVLPYEELSGADIEGALRRFLRHVIPEWTPVEHPFPKSNQSSMPLARATMLVLNRWGGDFSETLEHTELSSLDVSEQDLNTREIEGATLRIQAALKARNIQVKRAAARMIYLQYLEEIESDGSLHRMLVGKFAHDYRSFKDRYYRVDLSD